MTEQEFCEQYDKYKNTVYSVIFNYVQNVMLQIQNLPGTNIEKPG